MAGPGQPARPYAALDALDWENIPVAAATVETAAAGSRPAPSASCPPRTAWTSPTRSQAILIERYVTVKKNGQLVMRNCEAVLYITSLAAGEASPEDLLACVRGHWTVEHLHWLRDVIWNEDKSPSAPETPPR